MTVPIGNNSRNNDRSLDDVLNIRVESDEGEAARHDAEDDRADHRPGDAADAARETRAANDRRSNGIELGKRDYLGALTWRA